MSTKFKPMLAASAKTEDLVKLNFPLLASVKLDGIRAIVIDSVVYSRSLKPIRNEKVQELFGIPELNGFDGELILGDPTDPNCFNNSTALMGKSLREDAQDLEIKFFVFDLIPEVFDGTAIERATELEQRIALTYSNSGNTGNTGLTDSVVNVNQCKIYNIDQLLVFEKNALDLGYEGVMVKSPNNKYKNGRSTFKQGTLIKIKRFQDSEARIIGYEPKRKNVGERELTELGYSKTSSKQSDFIELETLGSLLVEDLETGIQFSIGSGYDEETRLQLWGIRDSLEDKIIKYKHFSVGVKEAPRFPTWIGFRDLDDM